MSNMKIDKKIIERIQDATHIEDVIADFPDVKLRRRGMRYQGICPFHDDKEYGNFSVYPKENCFKCFKCGAAGDAVAFLMNHEKLSFPDAVRWLGKKYNIEVDGVPLDYTPPPPRPIPPPLPTLCLPRWMVAQRMNTANDTLVNYIKTGISWGAEQRARIDTVLHEYCVGHATVYGRHEFTLWWQIDKDGNVRTAHYMKYKADGHRVKREQESYNTDWLHSLLSRHYDVEMKMSTDAPPYPYPDIYNPDKEEARMCLFGEHLLKRYPRATVKLVESEKTAVMMAIAYGNHPMQVWLACAGANNLTRERLKPLFDERRKIILYPDRDGVRDWKIKAEGFHYAGMSVDDEPVTKWWQTGDGAKADIADVVIRMINERPPAAKTIQEVKEQVPVMSKMIDDYDIYMVE